MPERLRVFAGDCTIVFEGTRARTQRGLVVVVVKPDNTTLVHDADGYQPVAWLTRPDSVTIEGSRRGLESSDGPPQVDDGSFTITARTDDQLLRVVSHASTGEGAFPVSEAGVPAGKCPDCSGPLVRTGGAVACLGCETSFGLPSGATVTDRTCEECGLPELRVERGDVFRVCLDPRCDALFDRVRERFDEEWACPDCSGDLGVQQAEGRVFLGCTEYPDCETTFSFPSGVVVDECACGLPVFETAKGKRCLDGTCEAWRPATDGGRTVAEGANGLAECANGLAECANGLAEVATGPMAATNGPDVDREEPVDGDCPRE